MSAEFDAIADRVNDLQAHPFADMFPMLSDDELTELAESIVRDGLLEKIIVYGDLILDGRNRYAALKIGGIPLTSEHFVFFHGSEAEAAAYVESKNINRRHLSQSQRAIAAADFAKMRGVDQKVAAAEYGVGTSMVNRAIKLRAEGPKNLQAMAEKGEIGLSLVTDAMRHLPARQLSQIKSPEALKEALRATGALGRLATKKNSHLVNMLTDVLDAMGFRDAADLKGYQVQIDTALQQLITIAERVSSAKVDEAQVA